jgi:hypothetical protein
MQISIQYVWLSGSLGLLFIWLVIYLSLKRKESKKEMLIVSLWTSLLGLTEPLFVPSYWNPPSLFDLAQKTGFDIESIIFTFSVGGIAAVIYEVIFKIKHQPVSLKERLKSIHRLHYFFLSLAPVIFLSLWFFTKINPIYSASIAMFIGGIGAIICRRDLTKKILVGGIMFLGIYFMFFASFNWAFPGYLNQVWNFEEISGILILGVPLEELLFALTLGMLWSGLYEHLAWRAIKN